MASFGGFAGFIVLLIALMITRAPVAVVLGIIGIVGTAAFVSTAALQQIANIAYTQSSNFVLIVVPLFVLMGEALASTAIGNDLFRAAHMWLRRIPGALAVATVFACAVFAAVCGSSPVTAATIGSMAVPEMIKRGYDKSLALGTAAAGGTLGILIPPSVPMIIYGVLTETSIGDLFIAGILPGIMMAFLFSATVVLKVMWRPELAPPLTERTPWPVKLRALGSVAPVLVLSVLVIGSIYLGAATPTEAGAVGAAGAILIAAAMGYLRWSEPQSHARRDRAHHGDVPAPVRRRPVRLVRAHAARGAAGHVELPDQPGRRALGHHRADQPAAAGARHVPRPDQHPGDHRADLLQGRGRARLPPGLVRRHGDDPDRDRRDHAAGRASTCSC